MRLFLTFSLALLLTFPLHAGLIGFYTFEGNANDVSGNGNHGTVDGATVAANGFEGQAYDFNTSNIVLPINISPGLMPQLTMGAWVNADSATAIRGILSQDNAPFDRAIGIDSRGCTTAPCFAAFAGTGSVLGGSPAVASQWVFVSVRYNQDLSTVTLNVDGTQYNGTGSLGAGTSSLYVGANPSFPEYFDGRIDNVFVFDEYLSDARINEIRLGGADAISPASAVPEPATFGLFGAALTGLVIARRSR